MSSAFVEEALQEIFWDEEPTRQYFARGLVKAVSSTKVSVTVKGSDPIALAKLSNYTPQVNDVVLALMMPSGGVVLGKIG